MSRWTERIPVLGVLLSLLTLLLSLLTLAATLSSIVGPDHHLLVVLALICALTLGPSTDIPLTRHLVSVRHRAAVCRATGVRATDPDRPGQARPRAPGLVS